MMLLQHKAKEHQKEHLKRRLKTMLESKILSTCMEVKRRRKENLR